MRSRSAFFVATGCRRVSSAALFHLAVLAIISFHHGILSKTIQKTSSQVGASLNSSELDLKLLDNMRPLRRTKRRWVITTLELEEEDKGAFPKLIGELFNDVSQDVSVKYLISGPGVDEPPELKLFSIQDDANGHVWVHRSIDREETASFTIRFDVADRNTGKIVDRSLFFNVKIKDINDNVPEFPKKEFNITMKENHNKGEPVFNVTAFDKDEEGSANSLVTYSLVSQTPHPKQPVFSVDPSSGLISITGCSNYETARAFRLLIQATDHGNPQLSSTATVNIAVEDSNNNLPKFSQENYHLDVPEGETKDGILRFRVEDKDSPNTPAWRAKYKTVRGNERGNFVIITDPSTNEGVLSVVKPLVYDGTSGRRLEISVENEEPFFSCESGLVRSAPLMVYSKASVNINVIDRNDAPQFTPPVLVVWQVEGVMPGTRIAQYTARDPDTASHTIRYKVASDPNGWVKVDENSGIVTTVKMLDRESAHVNNSVYTIVTHATDDGVPPLTGTGTIQLHLSDLNDNVPVLVTPSLVVCDEKEKGPFIIKAEDKDSYPNTGPFEFQLGEAVGNTKNSWRLGENFGDSVELFMSRSLPHGYYSVPVNIWDKQGLSSEQNLHVMVCRCLDGITCEPEMKQASASAGIGGGAVAALLAAFLLLLLGMGLLLRCSCTSETKKDPAFFPYDAGNQSFIIYNEQSQPVLSQEASGSTLSHSWTPSQMRYEQNTSDIPEMPQTKPTDYNNHRNGRIVSPQLIPQDFQPFPSWDQASLPYQNDKMNWKEPHARILERVGRIMNQRCYREINLEDMVSYPPHVYAEEGTLEESESSWSLPTADDDINSLPPDFLDTLGPSFTTLGKICGMELDGTHS